MAFAVDINSDSIEIPPFQLQELIPLVWDSEVPDSGYGTGSTSSTEVTCAQALGSEIYVGCTDGTLLRYALQATGPDSPESYMLLSRQSVPTNKKIQEIALCPSINRALILSDQQVHFYVLPSLDPIHTSMIRPIRNVLSLAVDEQYLRMQPHESAQKTNPVEFCVIRRANIGMYSLRERLVLQREVPNALNIKYGRRIGRYLCAADNENYDMIDLANVTASPLLPFSQVPSSDARVQPFVTPISDEDFLLLSDMGESAMGVFITGDGNPVRGTLQWATYPKSICFDDPHVFSLLDNKNVEIHSIESQAIVQVITPSRDFEPKMICPSPAGFLVPSMQRSEKMRSVKLRLDQNLSRAEPTESDLSPRPPVFTRSSVLLLSNHSVQALLPATLFSQAEAFLDAHKFDEVIDLADQNQRKLLASSSPDDVLAAEELRYIYQRLGFQCLSETRFEEAGAHLLAGEIDPRLLVYYFPDLRGNLLSSTPLLVDVFDGVVPYLPRHHTIDEIVMANLVKNYAPHIKPDVETAPPTAELRRILCGTAREMLASFLRKIRTRRLLGRAGSYTQSPAVNSVVDTVIAKILAETEQTAELYTLVEEANDIVIDEVEESFQKNGQYNALCKLYMKASDEEKLLEAWSKLADGIWTDEDVKDPVERMSDLLKRTTNRALVQRWSLWLLTKNADVGLSLLMSRDSASKRVSRDEEFALLEKISGANVGAGVTYLEHLILQKRSQDPRLHDRLAEVCANRLVQCMSDEATSKLWRAKASSYASSNANNVDTPFLIYFASTTPESESRNARIKAALFFQGSNLYDVNKVVLTLEGHRKTLGYELAILYGKLGRHEEAISTLIRDVQDEASAEAYCALGGEAVISAKGAWAVGERCAGEMRMWAGLVTGVGAPGIGGRGSVSASGSGSGPGAKGRGEEKKRELLKVLLRVYMSDRRDPGASIHSPPRLTRIPTSTSTLTPTPTSTSITRTARLLSTHASSLDATTVITDLPSHWPLRALQPFLERHVRARTHAKLEGRIVKAIAAGQNLETVDDAWLVFREQGAIVEEAAEEEDEYDEKGTGSGDEGVGLNEKASVVVDELTRRLGVEPKLNGEDAVAEIRVEGRDEDEGVRTRR